MSSIFNVGGDLIANNITANNNITVSNNITVGNTVTQSNYVLNISPSSSETLQTVFATTTDGSTPVQLASIATVPSTTYLVYCYLNYGQFTGAISGVTTCMFKMINISGTVNITAPVNQTFINDSGLTINASNLVIPTSVSGDSTNVIINVVGQDSQNLIWCGYFKIIQLTLATPMA